MTRRTLGVISSAFALCVAHVSLTQLRTVFPQLKLAIVEEVLSTVEEVLSAAVVSMQPLS